MANHRQITVEPDENQTAAGSKANRAALKTMFASAPYFNDYTKEKVQEVSRFSLIKKGDRGQSVEEIQIMLNLVSKNQLIVDGDFGAKTLAAVIAFQKKYKLSPDGIVGQLTYARLIQANRNKARKVIKYKIE